jgi:hypothetical protein
MMLISMPSPEPEKENILQEANEHEAKYSWTDAAKSYQRALELQPKTMSAAEIWEKIGFCHSLASRQAETTERFKELRQLASEAYVNSARLFEKEDGLKSEGRSSQCIAMAEYVRSWVASNPSEKRELLDESLRVGKKSLEAYEAAGEELYYGIMCNDLLLCMVDRLYITLDSKEIKNIAQEGISFGDKAIATNSKLGNKPELLRAYFTASLQSWYAANASEEEEKRKELVRKSIEYAQQSLKLSEEVKNPYYTAMANWASAFCTLLFTENAESSLKYAKEMLKEGTSVNDNYLKGVALYVLAFVANWITLREADPDKQKEGHKRIIQYSQDAMRCLQPIMQDYFIAEIYSFYAESCSSLARDVETGLEERQNAFKRAIEIERSGLDHANRSGSPDAMVSTLHALSKALHFYSNLETGKDEKIALLEEALAHRKEYNKIVERKVPANDWVRGVGKSYEGLIEADISAMETDKDRKRVLLDSAVADMGDGVSRCRRWILSRPVPTLIAAVARFEDWFGGILNELYLLTEDKKFLNKAIEVYEDASKDFKRVGLPSRVAESYWKMARCQDRTGRRQKASENFEAAFAEYKEAALKIPNFADFYLDYGTYMKGWAEIEKARFAHEHEEYADAMKHYEKVADFLKISRLWSYLSANFLAWSIQEHAEDLSRKENSLESTEAFKRAAELFGEAKEAFEKEIGKIQNLDEKEKAVELSKASIRRKDYCLARVNVEEARIHDRKGNHAESAEEYDAAADIFERILEIVETEADRKEIRAIASMCRAWEKMKMADRKASPELYSEASDLFLQTKQYSTKDEMTLLASGNSAFCKALEHGTKFEATREKDDFLKAKQFFESAANYYLKAGLESASQWTNATQVLFDAYNYMISAEMELDPEKKMKTYLLAEKCLEQSAKLYEAANYVGKKDEVLKTLRKVEEKREFALSLGELVAAPKDASSTRVISAPGSTIEEPVGLLKFEHALIQANLIAHQREIGVGEDLGLEIQFANLGKDMAFLMKIDEIIPRDFDLIEKPDKCVADDGFINLKGRKLAPLESAEIKLTLKSRKKGRFVIAPKMYYMDEAGEHKSCDLEQLAVNVKELGIRGWLRGPG